MKNTLLFSVMALLLSFGCSKDESSEGTMPLQLLSPVETTNEAICCLTFSWKGNPYETYYFSLSESETFTHTLADTQLSRSTFFYPDSLKEGTRYYWKVKTAFHQKVSSFVTVPGPDTKLALLTPNSTTAQEPCCINFSWSVNPATSSNLVISANPSFTDPIVNITTYENGYQLNQALDQNKTYYWKVMAGDAEKKSSFTVDILDLISGNYPAATITSEHYYSPTSGIPTLTSTTTETDTVTLLKENNKLRFIFNNTNELLEYKPEFASGLNQPNTVHFSQPPFSPVNNWLCSVHYLTNTVEIKVRTWSNGNNYIIRKIALSY